MKPTTILIYPLVGDEAYASPAIPLSLLTVATAARKSGYRIVIIDQRTNRKWSETLIELLNRDAPLCVGISSMSGPQILGAIAAAEVVRETSPCIPIVWGGVHASLMPREVLSSAWADIVIIGEGEETFTELLTSIQSGGQLEDVPGIAFMQTDGNMVTTRQRPHCDLDKYAILDYDLIDLTSYQCPDGGRVNKADSVSISTSRGCPFRCSYCYNESFHHAKWRAQSPLAVFEHLQKVHRKDIRRIFLSDEYFFLDLPRAREICRLLLYSGINFDFHFANCRLDQIMQMTDDDIDLFARTGFKDIFIGIESGSADVLDRIGKCLSLDTVIPQVKRLAHAGIHVQTSFMVGLPGETRQDIGKTLQFMERLLQEVPSTFVPGAGKFIPYPGTKSYEEVIRLGWQPPATLEEWGSIGNVDPCSWLGADTGRIARQASFLSSALDMKVNQRSSSFLEILRKVYSRIARWRCQRGHIDIVPEYRILQSPLGVYLKRKVR